MAKRAGNSERDVTADLLRDLLIVELYKGGVPQLEIRQIVGWTAAASNLMALGVSVQNVQSAKRTQQLRGAVALRSCRH